MWGIIAVSIIIVSALVYWFFLRKKDHGNNYDEIIKHLDEKIFPGGDKQKKEGARQVMHLLKNKINIQEAEELYIQKISLFYFEKYDSKNYDLIHHLTKFENSKVDFFDKIELYNYFAHEHIRYSQQNWVDGFALHEIVLNSKGKAVDYRYLDINQDFENLTGLKKSEVIGRTVRQVFPGIEDFWIKSYGNVAVKGDLAKFEHFDQSLNKKLSVTAYSPRPKQFISFIKEVKSANPNQMTKRA